MPNFIVFQGADATSIVALVVAILTFLWNEVRYRRQHKAEKAVEKLLTTRGWTLRTFETIRGRIGGYDDDLDELRRLLVRSGAIRFRGKNGEELWGLLKKNKSKLE